MMRHFVNRSCSRYFIRVECHFKYSFEVVHAQSTNLLAHYNPYAGGR